MSKTLGRRFLLCALALVILCAGCDGIAHISALQPPSVPRSSPIALPAEAETTSGTFQRGIDVVFYTWPGENVAAAAAFTVHYIVQLHANAISVSFPFFMDGTRSGSVHATKGTPTPAQLTLLAQTARNAGLRVSLRPLLDQSSLGRTRVFWVPANEAAWFRSYERFLRPYAQMAQQNHVSEFIVGTELAGFDLSHRWNGLDRYMRRWYSGTLACADNWDAVVTHGCGASAAQTVDAYPPAPSASRIAATWLAYDNTLPAGTVETEVDIGAADKAWRQPWKASWPGEPIDEAMQARWFTAACNAAEATHMGGIYFWGIPLGTALQNGPAPDSQTAWGGGLGARAISNCFASIERTGK